MLETVARNPGARAVKMSAYLASIEVDVVPLDDHVTVAIAAYDPQADVNAHKARPAHRPKTLRLWIEKTVRNRRKDIVPPQAKVAANYTSPMWAKWNARRRGYDEILLIDEQGHVAEGPTTNVFLVDQAGTLVTPEEEAVLLGVTRRSILEIARSEGIPVKEAAVSPEDLFAASEVFLTGTTAGVWPVESVDDRKIGGDPPGPVARRLAARFRRVIAGEDEEFASWLTYVGER
ncbi:MAG: aminotransferase class IV [Myxococcota bacterium]